MRRLCLVRLPPRPEALFAILLKLALLGVVCRSEVLDSENVLVLHCLPKFERQVMPTQTRTTLVARSIGSINLQAVLE